MVNSLQFSDEYIEKFKKLGNQLTLKLGVKKFHFHASEFCLKYQDHQIERIQPGLKLEESDICFPFQIDGQELGKLQLSKPKISSDLEMIEVIIENFFNKLELELVKAENLFLTTVLDNLNEGVVACDASGTLKLFNKKTREFHGIPEQPIPPEQWADHYDIFYAGGTKPMEIKDIPLYRAFEGERVKDLPMVIARKRRKPLNILSNGQSLFAADGKKIGAVVTMRDETELKLELDKTQVRFKTIFEQSPLSMQICSTDGKTLLVNPAWKKLWGISDEVVENFILTDYNMLQDPILEKQGVSRYIQEGFSGKVSRIPIIRYDASQAGMNGHSRLVEGLIFPLKETSGSLSEIVLIHTDVTEKEELLSQLSLERNQFETVLKNMPAGILVLDKANQSVVLNNEQMENIQGRSSLGLQLGKDFNLTGFKQNGDQYQLTEWPILRSLINNEVVSNEEIRYINARGETLFVRISSAPIINPDGETAFAVAVVTDITQAKRIEMHKSFLGKLTSILITTLDYDQIISRIAESCVDNLADGCILDIVENDQIKRLVTKHRDSETQKLLNELQQKYPPTLDSPQPAARVIRNGEPELLKIVDQNTILSSTYDSNHALLIKKIGVRSNIAVPIMVREKLLGSICLLSTSERVYFDEHDLETAIEIARRAGLAIENSQLYGKAQKAIQQRDEFISIASHELKTPITSMKLHLQLASRALDRNSDGKIEASYFKKVTDLSNKQLNRITLLVEDMLDITRISSGKLAIKHDPEDLTAVISDIIVRLREEIDGLDSLLTANIQDGVVAECDSFRIEQVLTNLINNAIKYGEKSPIHVSLKSDDHFVSFSVSDKGPGIAIKDQDRVFHRFERAVPATNISGLGLGLFISRQIIEQHGGSLTLVSSPQNGSTFLAKFPKKF